VLPLVPLPTSNPQPLDLVNRALALSGKETGLTSMLAATPGRRK
jgi:hypothetical protein